MLLEPFLFQTRDGYLVGLAPRPEHGSPCANCVEQWLIEKKIACTRVEVSALNLRRDLLDKLIERNEPHVFYEIYRDGTAAKLECMVFPNPTCRCEHGNIVVPRPDKKNLNYAFSPIQQLKCIRYGTPSGNLWLTHGSGISPLTRQPISFHAVAREKDEARYRAVEDWMKKAAMKDIVERQRMGEWMPKLVFQTGHREPSRIAELTDPEMVGVGSSEEAATLDALEQLARVKTIKGFAASSRNPMLVVGTTSWLRQLVPFFIMQQYDIYLLFYPNSMPTWVVGAAAFSRLRTDEKPIFSFASKSSMPEALESAVLRLLESCRPKEWGELVSPEPDIKKKSFSSKLNLWWTHWIYRCPKIAFKDLIHLENYSRDLSAWKEYFNDGQPQVGLVSVNHGSLPEAMRHLLLVDSPDPRPALGLRNVRGIGSWATLRDSLA